MTNNVNLISNEEKIKLLEDKEHYIVVKSYRLSQAIAFLTNQKPIMAENTHRDKDINKRIYFYERNERLDEAFKLLMDTKDKYNKEDFKKINLSEQNK